MDVLTNAILVMVVHENDLQYGDGIIQCDNDSIFVKCQLVFTESRQLPQRSGVVGAAENGVLA